jgi:hypothetical protein
LRKIPALRLNVPRLSARKIFRLSNFFYFFYFGFIALDSFIFIVCNLYLLFVVFRIFFFIVCNLAVVKYYRMLWTVPFSRYSGRVRFVAKTYFIFLLSRASNRQIQSEYFFFTFIRKVTWLSKFETRKCSEVKDLTCTLLSVPWVI